MARASFSAGNGAPEQDVSGFFQHQLLAGQVNAVEVKQYLRMAGYGDKDIPALLDRTVVFVSVRANIREDDRTSAKSVALTN